MRASTHSALWSLLALALMPLAPARGADAESDALMLESAPVAPTPAVGRDTRLYLEGAAGSARLRHAGGAENRTRLSLDFRHSARLGAGWRGVISDRLDRFQPAQAGPDEIVNSLREAYLSWQPEGATTVLEFGRVNLRYGPGYGYNPTDFFRDGSLRAPTTADPVALREHRLGTVMLRVQRLWSKGSLSLALSPKLADGPSADGWSLDLGSTNQQDRALMVLGTQFSQRLSSQVLLYKASAIAPALGVNVTALVSDAAVAHLEWTRSREPDLADRTLALTARSAPRNRFVGGATYTTPGKLSVTTEYQYNGFGLDQGGWAALGATPPAQLAYLREALRLQELAPRQAYLIYITQKGLGLKDLDLTAYLRFNPGDDSRLAWFELRHHWPRFDLSAQWQHHIGRSGSEFGVLPDRRVLQVLGTYHF